MSNQQSEPKNNAQIIESGDTVKSFFKKNRLRILEALPQGFDPDRFLALCLNEIRKTPELAECTNSSLFGCMIYASQLALEPGLGHFFMNPRKNNKKKKPNGSSVMEAVFQMGYHGYMDLAYRNKKIDSIHAYAVREKDLFKVDLAKDEWSHEPHLGLDPGNAYCGYAVIAFSNGNRHRYYCPPERIQRAQESSSNKTEWGAWAKDKAAMVQKTAIINMLKYANLTQELARVNNYENNIDHNLADEFGLIESSGEIIETKSQADEMAEEFK